jgi:hypothetical protein
MSDKQPTDQDKTDTQNAALANQQQTGAQFEQECNNSEIGRDLGGCGQGCLSMLACVAVVVVLLVRLI